MRCSKGLVVVDTKIFAYIYMLESVLGHIVTHFLHLNITYVLAVFKMLVKRKALINRESKNSTFFFLI